MKLEEYLTTEIPVEPGVTLRFNRMIAKALARALQSQGYRIVKLEEFRVDDDVHGSYPAFLITEELT